MSSVWGDSIPVASARPAWIKDGDRLVVTGREDAPWTVNPIEDWRGVRSVRMEQHHPVYSVTCPSPHPTPTPEAS